MTAPSRSRPSRLSEQVYQQVHQRIASGSLDPARRLTETWLATTLGVSRTPVREALVRLRREGLLEGSPRPPVLASLTPADLEEIMEVRMLVEPYIAARVAERVDPVGVARLEAALAREAEAAPLRSVQAFAMANHDFRVCLLELAGNARLAETASRYDRQIQALRRLTLKERANRNAVLEGHRTILSAIARGDPSAAEFGMRALMLSARDAILFISNSKRPTRRKE